MKLARVLDSASESALRLLLESELPLLSDPVSGSDLKLVWALESVWTHLPGNLVHDHALQAQEKRSNN